MGSSSASGGLLVSYVDHALRSTFVGFMHRQHIRRVDGREVANIAREGGAGKGDVHRRQIICIFFGRIKQWGIYSWK